jgi:hypothetical protein
MTWFIYIIFFYVGNILLGKEKVKIFLNFFKDKNHLTYESKILLEMNMNHTKIILW